MGSFSELVAQVRVSLAYAFWHQLGQLSPQNVTLFVPWQGFEIQKVFWNSELETDTIFCAFYTGGIELQRPLAAKNALGLQDLVSTKHT